MNDRLPTPALRYAAFYLFVAVAWILFSDRFVEAIAPDLGSLAYFQTIKGLFFVTSTAVILYAILRRHRANLDEEIASRRRSEASTRAVEEKLHLATRAAHVGLWIWDVAADTVFYSPEWKRQIGYDDAEVSDDFDEWERRVHPEDLEGAKSSLQRVLASRELSHEVEFRFRHKDGSYRWILAQSSIERDAAGKPVRMLGSHIDITERRRAEEALRWHEGALELAHEAADQGVFEHDLFLDEIRLDGRARAHYGFDGDPSGLQDLVDRIHPEDRDLLLREIAEHRRPDAAGRFAAEFRVVLPDGRVRWIAVHVRYVFEGEGEARRSVRGYGTTQDVTERKRAEAALRESEERLRQSQKMEAVGQLAGGVAHDFNNMLVVIQGHVELIQMSPELPAKLRESCGEIGRAAERAAGLTRQLLLFSRRQVLQFRDLDLNAVVAETTNMLRRVLGEHIELEVRYAGSRLPVHADPGMLEQVLLNLVVNARDAMPGGGRLVIETREEEIAGVRFARLDVGDTGEGIPAEVLPRIFEPFFTTKEVGKGTGLGLATVFGVLQEHGGTVEVDSAIGRGTTFHVRLPFSTRGVPDARPDVEEALRGGDETVLLVEDEPLVRAMIVDLLTRLGYRVLEATSGVEALHVAASADGSLALVVSDLVMPGGISGLELGRRLAVTHPHVKIVYTSGYSAEMAGAQGDLVEGVNFLPKPFSPRALARLVRERLDGR